METPKSEGFIPEEIVDIACEEIEAALERAATRMDARQRLEPVQLDIVRAVALGKYLFELFAHHGFTAGARAQIMHEAHRRAGCCAVDEIPIAKA